MTIRYTFFKVSVTTLTIFECKNFNVNEFEIVKIFISHTEIFDETGKNRRICTQEALEFKSTEKKSNRYQQLNDGQMILLICTLKIKLPRSTQV